MGFSTLLADPPEKVELSFDSATSLLSVQITHDTKDPVKHRINQVTVELNDKLIITQLLSRQGNNEGISLIYKVAEARPGDEFKVEAKCIVFGKKIATLSVQTPPPPPTD
jgi:hypothetical protein